MKLSMIVWIVVVGATTQLASLQVEAKAIDTAKNLAKTVIDAAADKADSVTEIPQTGGVVQTMLHKAASVALDKGVDMVSAKYPLVAVAAPHIKKFSKPMLNKAHSKINDMFSSDETTTTVAPEGESTETGKTTEGPEEEKKPGVMEKIKSFVGVDNKDDEEKVEKEANATEKEEAKPAEKEAQPAEKEEAKPAAKEEAQPAAKEEDKPADDKKSRKVRKFKKTKDSKKEAKKVKPEEVKVDDSDKPEVAEEKVAENVEDVSEEKPSKKSNKRKTPKEE